MSVTLTDEQAKNMASSLRNAANVLDPPATTPTPPPTPIPPATNLPQFPIDLRRAVHQGLCRRSGPLRIRRSLLLLSGDLGRHLQQGSVRPRHLLGEQWHRQHPHADP